jgi:hypothetical protein
MNRAPARPNQNGTFAALHGRSRAINGQLQKKGTRRIAARQVLFPDKIPALFGLAGGNAQSWRGAPSGRRRNKLKKFLKKNCNKI